MDMKNVPTPGMETTPQPKDTQDMELEQMVEQRLRENFAAPLDGETEIPDERLKEMSKKLPDWSLEPPFSHLK